jgi:adenylate kinase
MKLLLLGPPGSGKGTIAERLEKEFHWKHISAGELLREEVAKGTTIGKDIQKVLEQGRLVPNELVNEIVRLEIQGRKHYILDGFPRSLEQAKHIQDITIDLALDVEVSEKEVIARLAGRRICAQGKHSYHFQYRPPKKAGICDYDKSRLIRRKDDRPATIKKRFVVYRKETEPVIRYYQRKGLLQRIDGKGSPEEVYRNVKRILKK